ncbi:MULTISPECIES: ABC transporter substrate-binding protein [unclassified Anaerobiospirillum]|uniref:ABC transporter substrate-binding protein n=1 Tax=unclassified Anaerobiospirillum TaxID=2647410 RepID=UPI001FF202CE|nr:MULTISPECIES: ABC transporter substrate-binding protein [unclassified Anaerobiospirillum]MCK0535499.1 ABC transporter substrate-binding protein [Anaerobiospirillum sp. NML120511]MCK0540695.1 ABC transporter substrate-binding protein [Anaerobiospirillum sp. NML02-A-032]
MKLSRLVCGLFAAAALTSSSMAMAEDYNVFLITMDQNDQHWVRVNAGAAKAAEELGNVKLQWNAPDLKDDAKQIEVVNNAVAAGADVILLAANGPTAVTAALKEADAQGVKIIYVDSPADFPGLKTFATDNKAAGKTAGEKLIETLKANGIEKGRIGIVGVNAATNSTVNRELGFREAFKGTDFEVLPTQYSDGDTAKAKDIAANYFNQGCVGIFGTNEGSSVGAGNAVKEFGEGVYAVGFDKSNMILSLVRGGQLSAVMAQNPEVMGYEGVKAAVDAMQGKDLGEKYVDTGVSVITKKNMADFL